MITSELLKNHPHAAQAVREWYIDKMIQSFKNSEVPAEFKETMYKHGLPDDNLINLIDVNARVLFDVFDDNGVIINVVHTNGWWSWDVNNVKSVDSYSSRKEAERQAVERSFQILNEKLNITLHEGQDSSTGGE